MLWTEIVPSSSTGSTIGLNIVFRYVNQKNKRPKGETTSIYWDQEELQLWETCIQAGTEIGFWLQGEGEGFLWEREGWWLHE